LNSYDITKDDPNFITDSALPQKDIRWINCQHNPIQVSGLALCQGERFWRLPESIIDKINEGVTSLAKHTAGGRIRFRTDSPYVALRVKLLNTSLMVHMPLSGQSGCDIYLGGGKQSRYQNSAMPASDHAGEYEAISYKSPLMEDVTINLPLYNGVKAVYIGVKDDARVERPSPYRVAAPVVYYGSSITQGGCASRPGNSYQAILSRWLDVDHMNLGFSGSAKGERQLAEYIAGLKMNAFVLDYDHNAGTAEYLEATHEKFFQIICAANPALPIIIVSRPDFETEYLGKAQDSRIHREIIYRTYENAKARGENVWFVDGETLFGTRGRDSCTVDGVHPNDLGFMRMAETLYPVLEQALRS
jgi:hypothetical protein